MPPQAEQLPVLAALAFAIHCAKLSYRFFENRWDEHYDDCAESAIRVSLEVVSAEAGSQFLAPEGYADYCVDISGLASKAGLTNIANAANAAAGAAYCASMVCDLYSGYVTRLSGNFYPNAQRAIDSAMRVSELVEEVRTDFERLVQLVEALNLSDFTPIPTSMVERGFGLDESSSP